MENNKNYSLDFMSGDSYRHDAENNISSLGNKIEINGENIKAKSSFSVNAKPFIFNKQQATTAVPAVNISNLLTLQNSLNQQQYRQQQYYNSQINHPLNQLLFNNASILNSVLAADKTRQPIFTNQNLNIHDILTLATLSNLASNVLSCLPSSLQQFYSQLNLPNKIVKSQESTVPTTTDTDNKSVTESTVAASVSASTILRNPKSKYPLEFEWSFWFFKNNRDSDWKDNIILLTSVDNVEDFWSIYNHLRPVNDLHEGCDYMFFKKGIQPMWEDDKNRDGGRWLISFDREQRQACLEKHWQNTLLSLIGSQYDKEHELINGAVVNVRYKADKLALWTKHYKEEAAQYKIGKRFKRILSITDDLLVYEIHDTNNQPIQNVEIKQHE